MRAMYDIYRRSANAAAAVAAIALVAIAPLLAGCQEPLFPERAPRSQYERYETLRGEASPRYAPQRGPGQPRQPALRERLAPRDGF